MEKTMSGSIYKWSENMPSLSVPCVHCAKDELFVVHGPAHAWIDCAACGARGPLQRNRIKAMASYKALHRLVQQARELRRVGNVCSPAEA